MLEYVRLKNQVHDLRREVKIWTRKCGIQKVLQHFNHFKSHNHNIFFTDIHAIKHKGNEENNWNEASANKMDDVRNTN